MIMNRIDISIITVAFKSQDQIKKWVESIVSTVKQNSFEIIISDNSPDHDTEKVVKELQKKYKNLVYIYNDANLGFSAGNNVAVRKAKGEFLLFLNPDMIVEKECIDGMIAYLKVHPEVGTATPAVYLPNGKLDDSCHRGFPTPWRAFCHFSGISKKFPNVKMFSGYNMTYLNLHKSHEIDALAGSFLPISRKLGDELKWWDEDYFFYGEDIDFCYRIKKRDLQIMYVPEYKALHYKGMSSGIKEVSKEKSQATLDTKIWATNQRFKAMEIFYNKHYKKKYPGIITWLVMTAITWKRQKTLKSFVS